MNPTAHRSTSTCSLPSNFIPISPPAPHRRAPRPPAYRPRRRRSRHMRMREPARCGLFTIEEDYFSLADESESCCVTIASAAASSEVLPFDSVCPYPTTPPRQAVDMPMDVDDEEVLMDMNRLSWSTSGSGGITSAGETEDGQVPITPNSEQEEFSFEFVWDGLLIPGEEEPAQPIGVDPLRQSKASSKPRRPPPLNLRYTHPFAAPAEVSAPYDDVLTPRSSYFISPSAQRRDLLPALPIVSDEQWLSQRSPRSPSTPTSRSSRSKRHGKPYRRSRRVCPDDPINLVSALEDLLASCGENTWVSDPSESDSSSSDELSSCPSAFLFPSPPSHLPHPLPTPTSHLPYCRTPTTVTLNHVPFTPPQKRGALLPAFPNTPFASSRETTTSVQLKGDHSFLLSMSRGEDVDRSGLRSPSSSVGSSSSTRSLPSRKGLPQQWTTFDSL